MILLWRLVRIHVAHFTSHSYQHYHDKYGSVPTPLYVRYFYLNASEGEASITRPAESGEGLLFSRKS